MVEQQQTSMHVSVLIAEGQPLMGEALAAALATSRELLVLPERPESGLDAVDAVLSLKPAVSLIDYWMPDIEGPAATRMIRARQPDRKIILLGWFHGKADLVKALASGAAGFFSRAAGLDELREVIMRVHAGDSQVVSSDIGAWSGAVVAQDPQADLWRRLRGISRREAEIIGLVGLNMSTSEIGGKLGIKSGTVKVHMRHILAKTGAASQREVIALARATGLIRN